MSSVNLDVEAFVAKRFNDKHILVNGVTVRDYPEESIVIVYVDESGFNQAVELANTLDNELAARSFRGFVTVKKADKGALAKTGLGDWVGLTDPRVSQLVDLLTARSRTSEIQPSLAYI